MNKFTKPEALPKSGHVTEVCKEWLVREDGALAYKLQSQEINDFYKGNRFRNAVVREDFPTALHEQIKEKENAAKHAEFYRRQLTEQEEHDKCIAKEIADKLERDLQEQQQRELHDSEIMAQQMQEIYVNLPPPPPPAGREKSRPPPRPAKGNIFQQQNANEPTNTSSSSSSSRVRHHQQQQQHHSQNLSNNNHQQQLPNAMLNTANNNHNLLVSDECAPISPQQQQNFNQFVERSNRTGRTPPALTNDNFHQFQQQQQHRHQFTTQSSSLSSTSSTSSSSAGAAATVAATRRNKLSPEKYDQLVGNGDLDVAPTAATVERHMQQHADDIELYADPCDYASLKEIGLPMAEIKEMSKKIKQEQKDELLARRLQEMESHDGLSQEDRDRLLAIEAQDKELAKMLQEREKAKAKRAKEKARLRKSQQKDSSLMSCASNSNGLHCGPLLPLPQDCMSSSKHSSGNSTLAHAAPPLISPVTSTQPHTDDLFDDMEAYSNPIDIINQQRLQNGGGGGASGGSINGGSLTRSSQRQEFEETHEDDIYTLPVDSCRPGQRPASLNIGPEAGYVSSQHNSMTRSENYSLESHDSLNGHDVSPRMNYTKNPSFDQSSSPTPPYMPIQGTRRSNSNEERKKKSRDKCTHQ